MHFRQFYNIPLQILLLTTACILSSCNNQSPPESVKKELLIYCGTTMVQPVRQIADLIEQRENCIVKIIKNGSGELYRSIKINQQGDLYIPGRESYMEKCLQEKLVIETIPIGFNRSALIVAKGNPLNIPANLQSLLNPNYRTVLGVPESGSIGKETQKILTRAGIYDQAVTKTLHLTNDSKDLAKKIRNNTADLVLNWHATAMWPENKKLMDSLPLSREIAPSHTLICGLLTFAIQPEIARHFMDLASSPEGQNIFNNYGFGE